MHLTLKQETATPPASSLRAQSQRFDTFRPVYNEERPHEAMGQTPPADHYQSSLRRYSGRLREPQYAGDQEVRRVRHNGEIRWRGTPIYLSESLAGEPVELAENECGKWQVRFGPVVLGHVDHKGRFHRPKPRRRRRKPVRG